jgi:hypothetical protein
MKRKIPTKLLYVVKNSNYKLIHYPSYDHYDHYLCKTLCGDRTKKVKRTFIVDKVTCERCIEILKQDGKLE